MKLVFATANQNKAKEIQLLIPNSIEILSLNDIHCQEEIPETQATIEGNASQKAFYVYEKYSQNCFADDTGLEIEGLNGQPGVLSARYAGDAKNANDNMDKVLLEMKGMSNRKARFKTVISLVINGKELQFEGVVNGIILTEKRGLNGFGYDAIFAPNQAPLSKKIIFRFPSLKEKVPKADEGGEGLGERSFAEMELSEKNTISHRAIAINKLVTHLNSLNIE